MGVVDLRSPAIVRERDEGRWRGGYMGVRSPSNTRGQWQTRLFPGVECRTRITGNFEPDSLTSIKMGRDKVGG